MKWLFIILGVICLLLIAGGGRRDSTLKDFGGGLRYEQWTEQDCRVIVHAGFNTAEVVVPGDVLWCRIEKGFIVGEKGKGVKPAGWMSSDWDCYGFFMLNRRLLDFSANTDEQRVDRALKWFETKQELEHALNVSKIY